jgi:hypothetical protein
LEEDSMGSTTAGADVKIGKGDIAEAAIETSKNNSDRLASDLQEAFAEAQKKMEQAIALLVAGPETSRVEEARRNLELTLKTFSASRNKPSRQGIAKAMARIAELVDSSNNAVATKNEVGIALTRIVVFLETFNRSETVIRNYLYTNSIQAGLQVRSLRRVLDKRLGAKITDEELKEAANEIVKEDEKRAKKIREEKQKEALDVSLKEAQQAAAVRASD